MVEILKNSAIRPYDREKAVAYAHEWALKRNPEYIDFEKMGGDCTNFASQVILAGCGIMNLTPIYGWYYINSYRRTASWTGVDFLHRFLVNNKERGPFAEVVDIKDVKPGDIAQLSFETGRYNHSPVIVATGSPPDLSNILIATHSEDQDNYRLTEYDWIGIRFLHILGARR